MKYTRALATLLLSVLIQSSCSAKLVVRVKKTESGPKLFINGKITAPAFFFVNYDTDGKLRELQLSEVESAGKAGVNIISFPLPGMWLRDDEKPDFTETDKRMDATIKHCPNALIIPRLGVSRPPKWWIDQNPDEMMLFDNGERGVTSVFSEKWRVDAAKTLRVMIEHLESKYGDHILGYHPVAQNTGEWFCQDYWKGKLAGYEKPAQTAFKLYLKRKYKSEMALRKAWNNPTITFENATVPSAADRRKASNDDFRNPEKEKAVIDYADCENNAYAEAANYMCMVSKQIAPNKLAMVFYGYLFELPGYLRNIQWSGHLGMRRLLDSPYVDLLCSPVSYNDRDAGGAGFFMSAVDSVQLAGKMWLVEDDTRTYLVPDVPEDIKRLKTAQETYGVLVRNFAHVLTHGTALWWMDLFGNGRFQGDDIWQMLGSLTSTYQAALPNLKPYKPEIAVIVDTRSEYYTNPSNIATCTLVNMFRKQFYRIGAPVGLYLLDDLTAGKVPPAKMYIFLDLYRLDDNQLAAIRKYTCSNGSLDLWMYSPGVINNNKLIYGRVEQIVGMKLEKLESCEGEISYGSNNEFVACDRMLPTYTIIDPSARSIATYSKSGKVAVASKAMKGYTNVFSGVTQLPSDLLRKLARQAGVHIYNDQNDVIAAGNGFVALAASSAGNKNLYMPSDCILQDVLTSQKYGPTKNFTFDMELGDSKIWKILPSK